MNLITEGLKPGKAPKSSKNTGIIEEETKNSMQTRSKWKAETNDEIEQSKVIKQHKPTLD